MPSDGKSQPKTKSKKRRRINVSETDSSDECDSPTVKTRRKQRINKLTGDTKKLTKEKGDELGVAGSSQNVQCDKNNDLPTNYKIPPDDSETGLGLTNGKPSESLKSPIKVSGEKAAATSSKSDDNVENNDGASVDECPICWTPFVNQEIAVPSSCDHCFCLQCIIEWSKNTNTCPVDRQTFNNIEVRPNFGAKATRYMPIATKRQEELFGGSDSESWEHYEPDSEEEANWNYESSYSSDLNMEEEETFFFSTDDEQEEERHSSSMHDDEMEERQSYSPPYDEEEEKSSFFSSNDEEEPGNSFSSNDNEEEEEERDSFSSSRENEEFSPNLDIDSLHADESYWPTSDDNSNSVSTPQETEEQSSSFSPLSNRYDSRQAGSSTSRSNASSVCSSVSHSPSSEPSYFSSDSQISPNSSTRSPSPNYSS